MKTFLLTVMVLALPSLAQAQDNLTQAFQNEYVYNASQKEALLRQKTQMNNNFRDRIARTKAQVHKLQQDLAQLTAQNDERHETLMDLEKQKKELARRGSSLESTYKKAAKLLTESERGLRFDPSKDKSDIVPPADLSVAGLEPLFARANELLQASGRVDTYDGVYLDSEDRLAEGRVTRVGRVAAFVSGQGGDLALGPNGAGNLKALDKVAKGQFFVFDNINEAARLQRPATWLESLADAGPVLFLAMMLLMVAGLFLVLVKI